MVVVARAPARAPPRAPAPSPALSPAFSRGCRRPRMGGLLRSQDAGLLAGANPAGRRGELPRSRLAQAHAGGEARPRARPPRLSTRGRLASHELLRGGER